MSLGVVSRVTRMCGDAEGVESGPESAGGGGDISVSMSS